MMGYIINNDSFLTRAFLDLNPAWQIRSLNDFVADICPGLDEINLHIEEAGLDFKYNLEHEQKDVLFPFRIVLNRKDQESLLIAKIDQEGSNPDFTYSLAEPKVIGVNDEEVLLTTTTDPGEILKVLAGLIQDGIDTMGVQDQWWDYYSALRKKLNAAQSGPVVEM